MDLFCVSTKSRRRRGKHGREGTDSDDEKTTSIIRTARIEARPRRKNSEKYAQRQSRAMSHLSANSPRADGPAHHANCVCARCYVQQFRPRSARGFRDHLGHPAQLAGPGDHPAREIPNHSARLYVHPYSIQHFHFPVVDHSTVCHGRHPAPYPAYYVAVVPVAATPRDVDAALLHRPGLVAMARLSGTNELVDVRTFPTLGALYDASLQLEVWDSEDGAEHV
ncbi:hypothetical protein F5B18DRAFT_614308 [Nemania serpens]|nr:hypothetical protein F5B18DRAFT_614308 [Nemania serpens]